MTQALINQRQTGTYQKLGELNYFIPNPLPTHNPPFNFNTELIELYGQTMQALGRLNEMAERLPSTERFIKGLMLERSASFFRNCRHSHNDGRCLYRRSFCRLKQLKK